MISIYLLPDYMSFSFNACGMLLFLFCYSLCLMSLGLRPVFILNLAEK